MSEAIWVYDDRLRYRFLDQKLQRVRRTLRLGTMGGACCSERELVPGTQVPVEEWMRRNALVTPDVSASCCNRRGFVTFTNRSFEAGEVIIEELPVAMLLPQNDQTWLAAMRREIDSKAPSRRLSTGRHKVHVRSRRGSPSVRLAEDLQRVRCSSSQPCLRTSNVGMPCFRTATGPVRRQRPVRAPNT